ncbi:MAG: Trk system potassium transporter TrkA [Clostridia bacterium]|nr:Trk system potassium transporter TrkA [Clostridia bacterium]
MKIIIIGCGQVGATLSEQLAAENHDVTIIDTDAARIHELSEEFDIMGVCGNGISIATLGEAGIEDTDILIAVTESDEVNLLCALMAKKVSKCSTIARVRNPIYSGETEFIRSQMGISMIINPDLATAIEISQLVKHPSAETIDSFAGDKVRLAKIKITDSSVLADTEIKDIAAKTGCEMLVCAIERGDEIIIPGGNNRILTGDTVSFVVPSDKLKFTFSKLGLKYKHIKNTMIVGGGRIAHYLARMLLKDGIDVKILEKDRARCEWLDEQLPDATIIQGDGTDKKQLVEEGISATDAFVATTSIDEENIFLSMYAKEVSGAKRVSKVDRLAFDNIIEQLDIGSVVYPNYITADYIMQYVRAKQNFGGNNVSTLYRLLGNKIEALEFKVQGDSPVIGKPLYKLDLKQDLLICCICRGDKIIIPGGSDCIEKGDSVIIVTRQRGLQDIRNILKD